MSITLVCSFEVVHVYTHVFVKLFSVVLYDLLFVYTVPCICPLVSAIGIESSLLIILCIAWSV